MQVSGGTDLGGCPAGAMGAAAEQGPPFLLYIYILLTSLGLWETPMLAKAKHPKAHGTVLGGVGGHSHGPHISHAARVGWDTAAAP